MKNNKLNITAIILFFASAFIGFGFLQKSNKTNESSIITLMVINKMDIGGVVEGRYSIIGEEGVIKTEELPLFTNKSAEENAIKVNIAMINLKKEGYSLVTSNITSYGTISITNYIFQK